MDTYFAFSSLGKIKNLNFQIETFLNTKVLIIQQNKKSLFWKIEKVTYYVFKENKQD